MNAANIGENLDGVNLAPRRRQTLASMVTRRAIFHKFAFCRIKLNGVEIDMLDTQRLHRGSHSAPAVCVDLHPKSDAEPARLEHAAPLNRNIAAQYTWSSRRLTLTRPSSIRPYNTVEKQ